MKLHLTKVRLRNFRVHEDYTFEPMEEGVTAIVGKNGHGKSTIIDGIAWAIYGTKPNSGIKNSSWRRLGAPEDEESFVDAVFDLDGSELRVKRSIVNAKTGGTKCECWLDGTLEAGPAVSHAESWLTKKLGLDESGFLSTVLVQQKHVNQLVAASRTERRRTLEKLTGITAITSALDQAKLEEKTYSKAVDALGIDDGKLPVLRKTAEDNEALRAKTLEQVSKMEERLAKLDESGRALRGKVDEMDSRLVESRRARDEKTRADSIVDSMTERMAELSKTRDALKAALPADRLDSSETAEVRRELETAEAGLLEAKTKANALQSTVAARPTTVELDDAGNAVSDAEGRLAAIDVQAAVDGIEESRAAIAVARAEGMAAKKSLGELSGVGDDGAAACPTCRQPLTDPSGLISELEAKLDATRSTAACERKKIEEFEETVKSADAAREAVSEAKTKLAAMDKAVEAAAAAESELPLALSTVESAEATVKSLRTTVSRFNEYKAKYDEYDRVMGELKTVVSRLEAASKDSRLAAEKLDEVGSVNEESLARLRTELEDKRSKRADLNAAVVGKKGEAELAAEKARAASAEADSLEAQMEKRKGLLSKLEVSSSAVMVLGKFREHLILSAIPQVTDYASELINKISDGKFTSIAIDKKFDVSVETGDGVVESVSQLSGGEEDLVAICLRLAISVMLSDGTPTMLILDEVLTAMDSDRAAAILEAMQGISGGQIIIVAHNEIIKSIADKVVEL